VEGLAAIASAVSGIAAVWAAYAGLRRARREARALCVYELDQTRQRLAQARTESEQLARQLHAARMKP
jgi:hypothetical protein